MNVITRGIRNAFRNVIRTLSLVTILGLSIGLSLAMLLAHQAVGAKIDSVKASVGNTVSVSPAGVRGFDGGGNALTETEVAKVKTLAHVTSVTESLSDRLTTTNTNLVSAIDAGSLGQRFAGNSGQSFTPRPDTGGATGGPSSFSTGGGQSNVSFTPPVTVVGSTDPTNLSNNVGGGTFTLKSGKVFASNSTENVALLGSTLATKNNLKVGSTFTAYGQTVTVAGIFDAGNTFSNNQVIMPLVAVQTLSSQAGALTSAILNVDSVENVASVTTAASTTLGSVADVTNDSTRAQASVAPLQNIQTISLYSLIGSVIAGAVIILMTMVMIVRERRREIGVLKAIGASNVKVVGQFMSEAITLTMLSAVIGIVIGAIAGNPITKLLVNNASSGTSGGPTGGPGGGGFVRVQFGGIGRGLANIHAAVGFSIILYGLLAALLIAVVGSAVSAFFIAKVRPAEVMRAE
ncbi:MAG: transporter permease, putative transport system permease protein [Candidatus Saccharibacteria bacterium]|nr:transporter permease, putative transport system permease protein [Candidatus Saccharibacteria bacterium]